MPEGRDSSIRTHSNHGPALTPVEASQAIRSHTHWNCLTWGTHLRFTSSLEAKAGSRNDVLVQPEDVVRVPRPLQLDKPFVLRVTIDGPHHIFTDSATSFT